MERRRELASDGAMTIAEAVRFSSMGRTKIFALLAAGQLPYARIGRRRLIPRAALVEYLAAKMVGVRAD
jgi:excisionase family DNA binding protein